MHVFGYFEMNQMEEAVQSNLVTQLDDDNDPSDGSQGECSLHPIPPNCPA